MKLHLQGVPITFFQPVYLWMRQADLYNPIDSDGERARKRPYLICHDGIRDHINKELPCNWEFVYFPCVVDDTSVS